MKVCLSVFTLICSILSLVSGQVGYRTDKQVLLDLGLIGGWMCAVCALLLLLVS